MNAAHLFHLFVVRLLPILVLGLLGARALAQGDPPGRVARLNHAEGPVVFSPAGDNEWIDAVRNRPLTRGDRLWTDKGSRAEVQLGSSAVRLDGLTQIEILALDDQSAQVSVIQGTVYLRVRSLPEGDNFEIDTPNLAYRVAYPGDYRIDVDAARGTTRVTIHSGTGAVYGEGGQVQPLGGGQQITFRARNLAQIAAQESPPQDNFDRWAADRNRREDQSVSARYVPREVVGYQQLDAHGLWMQDETHGPVWFPQGTPANWAPYRDGHWEWIPPWGWTWHDDAPWGFAPFHYGRWAMVDSRWAWVPGRLGLKPVYAPALVAFIGGGRSIGVAWFPLAPGETWQPPYPASPVYVSNLNRSFTLQANQTYAHQRRPDALTTISAEDFHRGKPARGNWLRVAANSLTNAQVVPPPPAPDAGSVTEPAVVARKIIPSEPMVQAQTPVPAAAPAQAPLSKTAQIIARARALFQTQQQAEALRVRLIAEQQAKANVPAQPVEPAVRQAAAAKPAEPVKQAAPAKAAEPVKPAAAARPVAPPAPVAQAKPDQLARRADQARREQQLAQRAEQVKREQQLAKQAEQGKREQQAKRAEQARREQVAKHAEQATREQLAKREAAKREQLAKRAEQQRREEQVKEAKRAEQAKREAVARREEQQRREAHARHVEQAQRAAERDAQALREQRAQREELLAKREAQEREQAQQREQAQRAAWARQQQALAEQWRRDQQAWEQQQQQHQQRTRNGRPDLRDDGRSRGSEMPRGIPIISSRPMS